MLDRLRRWLSPKPAATASEWVAVAAQLPLLAGLDTAERARLFELGERFLRAKAIEPVGGLEVMPAMRLALALQACLPILNLGLDYYRGWYSVVLYPTGFVVEHEYEDEYGTVHVGRGELVGEAWERGPVILSWEDVESGVQRDGFNVVIHEFAHKLDMLQGSVNGLPPLHAEMDVADWHAAFSTAYDDLCARAEHEDAEASQVDLYGAESPAEFFAVVSETFFEDPHALLTQYPAVYEQLRRFYRQDPVRRLTPLSAAPSP